MTKSANRSDYIRLTCLGVTAFLTIVFYLYNFGPTLSNETQVWGQFGDYIGGILNPLVAFTALYYLYETVKIQRNEMMKTTKALKKTSYEQARIANINFASMKSNALTNQLDIVGLQISQNHQLMLHALERIARRVNHPEDAMVYDLEKNELIEAKEYLTVRHDYHKELLKKQNLIISRLNELWKDIESHEADISTNE